MWRSILTECGQFCLEGLGEPPSSLQGASGRIYIPTATMIIAFGAFFFMHDVRANVYPARVDAYHPLFSTQRQHHS